MRQFQKVIKYLAIALAIFVIFQIVSLLMNVGSSLFFHSSLKPLDKISIKGKVRHLEIDVLGCNIFIEKGKSFHVETDNEYVYGKREGNKLVITEEKHNLLKNKDFHGVTIYLPDDYLFDSVDIEAGAGKLSVSYLNSKVFNLKLGAGKADIGYLSVLENSNIHGGVGSFTIHHGNIQNLNLELGVGKTSITSSLGGHNTIESGVGSLSLNLVGYESDYQIKVQKVIGSVFVQEKNMKDYSSYGNGDVIVDLKGGIGSVKILFEDEDSSL